MREKKSEAHVLARAACVSDVPHSGPAAASDQAALTRSLLKAESRPESSLGEEWPKERGVQRHKAGGNIKCQKHEPEDGGEGKCFIPAISMVHPPAR